MASDFTVRGVEASGTEVSGPQRRDEFAAPYGAELGYEVRGAVSLAGVSRGGGEPVELAGEDDDVIEIEKP